MEGRWGIMAPHILRIPSHPSHTPHPPHILRFATYVRGYRDGVFQTHGGMGSLSSHPRIPRTFSATLRMYGVTEMASSRRTIYPRFFITIHIIRFAIYVQVTNMASPDAYIKRINHITKKASDCSDAFSILGNINYP